MQKQQLKALKQAKKTTTKKSPAPQHKKSARLASTRASKPTSSSLSQPTLAHTPIGTPTPLRTQSSRSFSLLSSKSKTNTNQSQSIAFQSFSTPLFATTNTFARVSKQPQHLQFVQPLTAVSVRNAATFKKVASVERKVITHEDVAKQKEARTQEVATSKPKKIPTLNDLMRQLYKKIHPDLMMGYPEQKEQNEKSLGTFQNFIGQLKTSDGNEKYPVIKNASLPFYLRTPTPGHFQRVELFLHTDATFNKKAIEKQLCNFFKSINLSSQFRWDEEYFPFKGKPDFKKEEGEEHEAEAADAAGPGGNETYEQFMERIKKQGEKAQQEQQ